MFVLLESLTTGSGLLSSFDFLELDEEEGSNNWMSLAILEGISLSP
jgi:hypothetical protein